MLQVASFYTSSTSMISLRVHVRPYKTETDARYLEALLEKSTKALCSILNV